MLRRVAYSGFRKHHALYQALTCVFAEPEGTTIVAGHGGHVDLLVEETAEARGLHVESYPADWQTYKKAAGHLRNQRMVDTGLDQLEAFPTFAPECRGTWDMIRRARKAGIPTRIHLPQEPAIVLRTARLSKRTGRLLGAINITRMTGSPQGLTFAPSWPTLRAIKDAGKEARAMVAEADRRDRIGPSREAEVLAERAMDLFRTAWAAYEVAFREEMRESYGRDREFWHAFLQEQTMAVLLCYCPSMDGKRPKYCHRRLVVGYLCKVAHRIGRRVVDGGEVVFER